MCPHTPRTNTSATIATKLFTTASKCLTLALLTNQTGAQTMNKYYKVREIERVTWRDYAFAAAYGLLLAYLAVQFI